MKKLWMKFEKFLAKFKLRVIDYEQVGSLTLTPNTILIFKIEEADTLPLEQLNDLREDIERQTKRLSRIVGFDVHHIILYGIKVSTLEVIKPEVKIVVKNPKVDMDKIEKKLKVDSHKYKYINA